MKKKKGECLQKISAKLGGAWKFPRDAPWTAEVRFYLGEMPIGSVIAPKACAQELVRRINRRIKNGIN